MRSSMRQPGTFALPSGRWLELPHLDEVGESPDADQVADGARRQLPLFMAVNGGVERDPAAINRNLDAVTDVELERQQCGAGDLFIGALVADGQHDLESVDDRFHAFDAPGERFRMSLLRMAVDATDQREDAVLDRDGHLTGFQGLIRLQRQADSLSDLVVAHFATSVGCRRCGVSTNLGPRCAGAKTALPCRGPAVPRAPVDYSLSPRSWLASGSRITLPTALRAGCRRRARHGREQWSKRVFPAAPIRELVRDHFYPVPGGGQALREHPQ